MKIIHVLKKFQSYVGNWGKKANSSVITVYLKEELVPCLFILFMGFSSQEYWSGLPAIKLKDASLQAINAGEDVEKREPSYTVGGNAN